MDNKHDLKSALRGLAAESGDARPHVGTKRLIAYRQGTLPAAERDEVQEHLSLCARCTELLREIRDFEAASRSAAAGPESLRKAAWDSLVQRLPSGPTEETPTLRPVATLPRRRRTRYLIRAAIAALLVAVAGLAVLAQLQRQRLAGLEHRMAEREAALSGVQRSLEETGRRLDAARGRMQDLEQAGKRREGELTARVGELTSVLEQLRRKQRPDRLAEVEVSVAPRFGLRGEESSKVEFLKGRGAANPLRPQAGRVTAALVLPGSSDDPEIRIELVDRAGEVLWSDRRPAGFLLGDGGVSVSIAGLDPGRYHLRIEGLRSDRTVLLDEYRLDIESP